MAPKDENESGLSRRSLLKTGALAAAAPLLPRSLNAQEDGRDSTPSFELEEKTVAELAAGLRSGEYTSIGLTEAYLARIEELDRRGPTLRAVIEVNPDAHVIADELDKELKEKGPRGPLHGIPILIKDNIATADRMMTTAGSLALQGSVAARDAFIVERLRAAGAVILGKTNLSEWANFRSTRSSSGFAPRAPSCWARRT